MEDDQRQQQEWIDKCSEASRHSAALFASLEYHRLRYEHEIALHKDLEAAIQRQQSLHDQATARTQQLKAKLLRLKQATSPIRMREHFFRQQQQKKQEAANNKFSPKQQQRVQQPMRQSPTVDIDHKQQQQRVQQPMRQSPTVDIDHKQQQQRVQQPMRQSPTVDINNTTSHKQQVPVEPQQKPVVERKTTTTPLLLHFLVVSCHPKELVPKRRRRCRPHVVFSYPRHNKVSFERIEEFAFPQGVDIERLDLRESSSMLHTVMFSHKNFCRNDGCFVFRLQADGSSVYGCCVTSQQIRWMKDDRGRSHQAVVPIIYCALSHVPWVAFHFKVVFASMSLLRLHRLEANSSTRHQWPAFASPQGQPQLWDVPVMDKFLGQFFVARVKTAAGAGFQFEKMQIPLPMGLPAIDNEDEWLCGINSWALPLAFALMKDMDTFLVLFECLLREFKVIVVSSNPSILTSCCLCCRALLSPLAWESVFLPLLPVSLLSVLDAPVPFLIGVQSLPAEISTYEDLEDPSMTLVWFPEEQRLWQPVHLKRVMPNQDCMMLYSAVAPSLDMLHKSIVSSAADTLSVRYAVLETSKCQHTTHHVVEMLHSYVASLLKKLSGGADPAQDPLADAMRQTQMVTHHLDNNKRGDRQYR